MSEKDRVPEVTRYLLKKHNCKYYNFYNWREPPVVQLCKHCNTEVNLNSPKPTWDNLCLCCDEVAAETLHQIIGYVVDAEKGVHDHYASVEDNIVSVANLDAFVVKLASCLGDYCRDTVGGHRQEMDLDSFTDAFPNACRQCTGKVRQDVQMWESRDLKCSFDLVATGETAFSEAFKQEATLHAFTLRVQRHLIACSSE